MISICRGLIHLRNGTLLRRLQQEWRQYIMRKRLECWEAQVGKKEHFAITLQRGVQMRLYFDDQLSRAIAYNQFERQEQDFLNAFLRPGDIFVDVGANIGLFTLIAASRVENTGRVYAFEPCSDTHRRLVENVQLNQFGNVSTYQLALSSCSEQLEMTISRDGFGAWNSLARPIAGELFAIEKVQCTTWDDFARKNDLIGQVTMIKIDVEGWEKHVLKGGTEILSRADAPVLQVEFTEQAALSAGSSCKELYHLLEELGYQMFVYNATSRTLVPDPVRESYPYLNLIAVKQLESVITRLRRPTIKRGFR